MKVTRKEIISYKIDEYINYLAELPGRYINSGTTKKNKITRNQLQDCVTLLCSIFPDYMERKKEIESNFKKGNIAAVLTGNALLFQDALSKNTKERLKNKGAELLADDIRQIINNKINGIYDDIKRARFNIAKSERVLQGYENKDFKVLDIIDKGEIATGYYTKDFKIINELAELSVFKELAEDEAKPDETIHFALSKKDVIRLLYKWGLFDTQEFRKSVQAGDNGISENKQAEKLQMLLGGSKNSVRNMIRGVFKENSK